MITRIQWIYISIFLTAASFVILTPAFFEHIVEMEIDEDVAEIAIAWAISGINLIIRLLKIKGWNNGNT